MPKCTINGKEIEVKEGTTVIEAFQQAGEKIAHYCWHPGLSVAGVCRLCMVDIEGNPRLQIGCNTAVTEGMKVSNKTEKVKESVKWGLDFHLINHPLDCPICDQAGECGLQEQYMAFGQYDSEMSEAKVKKHKVVDLGPTVVLDSERCILCSRCVRFTTEVSKSNELGIFNRGDRSEIGTHDGKPLNNPYSLNTVDICPVGALTSKDFRFRQRVWYLKNENSICPGCSTGCSVSLYFNKEGFFRVKPAPNPDVNGYWMCDEGRKVYRFLNKENRQITGLHKTRDGLQEMAPLQAIQGALDMLSSIKGGIGLVLTGQYTTEEYEALIGNFVEKYKSKDVYHWNNNPEKMQEFDGLLLRGDKNPNTAGLKRVMKKYGINTSWKDLEGILAKGALKCLVVAGPENNEVFPDLIEKISLFSKVDRLVWLGSAKVPSFLGAALEKSGDGKVSKEVWQIPIKTFVEKEGTFLNALGMEQKISRVTTVVPDIFDLAEAALLLSGSVRKGSKPPLDSRDAVFVEGHRRTDQVTKEHIKKNEFLYKRGSL